MGSFIGSSAITTALTLKTLGLRCGVVCIDPFTGMVDMWADRKALERSWTAVGAPKSSIALQKPTKVFDVLLL